MKKSNIHDRDDYERPSPERVRQVIERLFREGTAVSRADNMIYQLFTKGISASEGTALAEWIQREDATSTIETGLGFGISALFICEGLLANGDMNARHIAIDPYQGTRFGNCALQFLDDAGVADLVEYHQKGSEIVLPRLLDEGRQFDLAFVDGAHKFEGVFIDLVYLNRLVRPGGIIFVDDFQAHSVARAVRFSTGTLKCEIEETFLDDPRHQWVVMRTPSVPVRRFAGHISLGVPQQLRQ